jgi:hypothetical protein
MCRSMVSVHDADILGSPWSSMNYKPPRLVRTVLRDVRMPFVIVTVVNLLFICHLHASTLGITLYGHKTPVGYLHLVYCILNVSLITFHSA